jgi:hypothetical protein
LTLHTLESVREVSLPIEGQTKERTNGVGGTNMGSTNTIEDDMGHPGIDSNQMPTIRSLQNSSYNHIHTNQVKGLTKTDIDGSYEGRPM